jgi:hypothetical protein
MAFPFDEYVDESPDTGYGLPWAPYEPSPARALRLTLRDEYAGASDEEMEQALADVLDSMSLAEAFNFTSALNQIGKTATQVVSDPTFNAVAKTALPIVGTAAGMYFGPVGAGIGGQLGSLAANALPPPRTSPSSPARPPSMAPPGIPPSMAPGGMPPGVSGPVPSAAAPSMPVPQPPMHPAPVASPVAGGSTAAAQGLILTQQPQVLQGLLSAALGQHGQSTVGGVPVSQLLGMLSQVFGQAAADADELMYLEQQDADAEGLESYADNSGISLYTSLVDADNLELAEALDMRGYW